MFQFPTGWNSTRNKILIKHIRGSFNSQRDGILPRIGNKISSLRNSFNSQRDGILLRLAVLSLQQILFQFPTGWNSTDTSAQTHAECPVSIPNGMEFYKLTDNESFCRISFNSQRDGILLYVFFGL